MPNDKKVYSPQPSIVRIHSVVSRELWYIMLADDINLLPTRVEGVESWTSILPVRTIELQLGHKCGEFKSILLYNVRLVCRQSCIQHAMKRAINCALYRLNYYLNSTNWMNISAFMDRFPTQIC